MTRFDASKLSDQKVAAVLPQRRDLFYGGSWQAPQGGYVDTLNPGTGESLGPVAEADATDVDAAVRAAHQGFRSWRNVAPLDRGRMLRQIAVEIRKHGSELALLDAANCGNPVTAMLRDAEDGADTIDYFAGQVTELKGAVTPMGPGVLNMSSHDPLGVCARILAYNHPLMFAALKLGAPIAAGNSVILKPPPQAPLSALRLFEIAGTIFPPGVLNLITGGRESGAAITAHPLVPSVSLVGSVPSGLAVARIAAERLKHVLL